MRNLLFLLALIPLFCSAKMEKRSRPVSMKTSVVVPCHEKHFVYLPTLLTYYQNQSCLPDEVVISLTGKDWNALSVEDKDHFTSLEWPFIVQVVLQEANIPGPGPNRNFGCQNSTGDLIILQDADDIPHPRRVEYIKWLFENYNVDFLVHRWMQEGNPFVDYSQSDIIGHITMFNKYSEIPFDYVFNGGIAITRDVFNHIHWGSSMVGEDIQFNKTVALKYKYKAALNAPLMIYRWRNSSYSDG